MIIMSYYHNCTIHLTLMAHNSNALNLAQNSS
jgi:hypothetical protein